MAAHSKFRRLYGFFVVIAAFLSAMAVLPHMADADYGPSRPYGYCAHPYLLSQGAEDYYCGEEISKGGSYEQRGYVCCPEATLGSDLYDDADPLKPDNQAHCKDSFFSRDSKEAVDPCSTGCCKLADGSCTATTEYICKRELQSEGFSTRFQGSDNPCRSGQDGVHAWPSCAEKGINCSVWDGNAGQCMEEGCLWCGTAEECVATCNDCDGGNTVDDGECIGGCTDTDGGQNYFEKGTVKGLDNYKGNMDEMATYTDHCRVDRLTEFYCMSVNSNKSYITMANHKCDFGCEDGRCIKATELAIRSTDGGRTKPHSGVHYYDEGAEVKVEAHPATGYRFIRWEGSGSATHCAQGQKVCNFSISRHSTLLARFSETACRGMGEKECEAASLCEAQYRSRGKGTHFIGCNRHSPEFGFTAPRDIERAYYQMEHLNISWVGAQGFDQIRVKARSYGMTYTLGTFDTQESSASTGRGGFSWFVGTGVNETNLPKNRRYTLLLEGIGDDSGGLLGSPMKVKGPSFRVVGCSPLGEEACHEAPLCRPDYKSRGKGSLFIGCRRMSPDFGFATPQDIDKAYYQMEHLNISWEAAEAFDQVRVSARTGSTTYNLGTFDAGEGIAGAGRGGFTWLVGTGIDGTDLPKNRNYTLILEGDFGDHGQGTFRSSKKVEGPSFRMVGCSPLGEKECEAASLCEAQYRSRGKGSSFVGCERTSPDFGFTTPTDIDKAYYQMEHLNISWEGAIPFQQVRVSARTGSTTYNLGTFDAGAGISGAGRGGFSWFVGTGINGTDLPKNRRYTLLLEGDSGDDGGVTFSSSKTIKGPSFRVMGCSQLSENACHDAPLCRADYKSRGKGSSFVGCKPMSPDFSFTAPTDIDKAYYQMQYLNISWQGAEAFEQVRVSARTGSTTYNLGTFDAGEGMSGAGRGGFSWIVGTGINGTDLPNNRNYTLLLEGDFGDHGQGTFGSSAKVEGPSFQVTGCSQLSEDVCQDAPLCRPDYDSSGKGQSFVGCERMSPYFSFAAPTDIDKAYYQMEHLNISWQGAEAFEQVRVSARTGSTTYNLGTFDAAEGMSGTGRGGFSWFVGTGIDGTDLPKNRNYTLLLEGDRGDHSLGTFRASEEVKGPSFRVSGCSDFGEQECEDASLCEPQFQAGGKGSAYSGCERIEGIDCEENFGQHYWCASQDGWEQECGGSGEAVELDQGVQCEGYGDMHDYCVTCGEPDVVLGLSAMSGGTTDPATGNHSYEKGSQVTVEAEPADGYTFAGWERSGSAENCPQDSAECSFTITEDSLLSAHFSQSEQHIDCEEKFGQHYWCTSQDGWEQECRGSGEAVELDQGSQCEGHDGMYDYCVTCHEVELKLSAMNGGRTDPVSGTHSYVKGTEVTVEAVPSNGYEFDLWERSGSATSCVQGEEECSFTITEDSLLSAHFTCEPDCFAKECGQDGCGGTCGQCSAGETCESGDCVSSSNGCGALSTYFGSTLCGVNHNTGEVQPVGTEMSMDKLDGTGTCPSTCTCTNQDGVKGTGWDC